MILITETNTRLACALGTSKKVCVVLLYRAEEWPSGLALMFGGPPSILTNLMVRKCVVLLDRVISFFIYLFIFLALLLIYPYTFLHPFSFF